MVMLTIIFLVLPALSYSNLITKLPGEWIAVAGYPSQSDYIVFGCGKRTFEYNNIMRKCSSEDSELSLPEFDVITPPLRITGDNIQGAVTTSNFSMVLKEVHGQNDFMTAPHRCVSNPIPPDHVRFISDNYFLQYLENNKLSISAKIVPSEADLRNMIEADEELKSKEFQIYCNERLVTDNINVMRLTNAGAKGIRQTQKLYGDDSPIKIEIFDN